MLTAAVFALIAAVAVMLWALTLPLRGFDDDLSGYVVLSWREWWRRVRDHGSKSGRS